MKTQLPVSQLEAATRAPISWLVWHSWLTGHARVIRRQYGYIPGWLR